MSSAGMYNAGIPPTTPLIAIANCRYFTAFTPAIMMVITEADHNARKERKRTSSVRQYERTSL
jgi:hypothetical protein